MTARKALGAWNGYLHAGAVVTLADTCCGYGTVRGLPAGAVGFTTVELKSNFFGSAREGVIVCVARPLHQGRTTQVWDAVVTPGGRDQTHGAVPLHADGAVAQRVSLPLTANRPVSSAMNAPRQPAGTAVPPKLCRFVVIGIVKGADDEGDADEAR